MGRKAKYTFEQKLKTVQDYQSGKKSAVDIAFELDMGKNGDNRIREWSNLYYSKEFKEMVVQDYVQNGLSQNGLAAKYNISGKTVIIQWIKRYNNHIEQRDYCPHLEVYMAERKKTTKEERMETSIMIAIIKKRPQNMSAAIPRSIHGYANMTAREQMA